MASGKLFIVATPIGNLKDITLRAIEVLKDVDLILAEDTRTTGVLLKTYGIATKTMSYHAHTNPGKHRAILEMLSEGKALALVSDAGTPTISDPGVLLIREVQKAFGEDIAIIPIPGASALIAALSASGESAEPFTFFGFLPHKKGRETLVKKIADLDHLVICYESSHRILKLLDQFEKAFSDKKRVIIARELTKHFEELKSGTATSLKEFFLSHPEKQKGEFVVLISPRPLL